MIDRLPELNRPSEEKITTIHRQFSKRIKALSKAEVFLRGLKRSKGISMETLSVEDLKAIHAKLKEVPLRGNPEYEATMYLLSFQTEMPESTVTTYDSVRHDLETPFNKEILHQQALGRYLNLLSQDKQDEFISQHLADHIIYFDPSFTAHERRVLQSVEKSIWKVSVPASPIRLLLEDLHTIFQGLNQASYPLGQLFTQLPITFDHECSPNLITLNEPDLYRVLWNLSYNAYKAMLPQKGGLPPKEGGKIKVSAMHEGQNTVITVADNGPGIDPQTVTARALEEGLIKPYQALSLSHRGRLKLIFEPRFTLNPEKPKSNLASYGNQGLGLSICAQKIKEMGGEIFIDSKPGQGTTFTIRLIPQA